MEWTNLSNKPPNQVAAARLKFDVIPFLAMKFCVSDEINCLLLSNKFNFGTRRFQN